MVREASERDASALLLVPGVPPSLRVRGEMERLEDDPTTAEETREIAFATVGEERVCRIGPEVGEAHRSFRVDDIQIGVFVARVGGEFSISISIFPSRIFDTDEIGMPKGILDACECRSGIIVFSGLAGSGKTTTAYAALDHINKTRACHICTVEDPIVCSLSQGNALVQQREIGWDLPDNLAGIKAAIVQDADVIFVMEVETFDDLQGCITAAETGRLVLMVLHPAATPSEAIRRMIEVFPEELRESGRRSLANSLRAVSTQLLMPKNGGGRVPAYGVLTPDDEMRSSILSGRDVLERTLPLPAGCLDIAGEIDRLRASQIISEEAASTAIRRI